MSDFTTSPCTLPCMPPCTPPAGDELCIGEEATVPPVPVSAGAWGVPAVAFEAVEGGGAASVEAGGLLGVLGLPLMAAAVVLLTPAKAGDDGWSPDSPDPPGSPPEPPPSRPDLGPAFTALLLQQALRDRGHELVPRDFEQAGHPARTQVGLPDANGVLPARPGVLPLPGQPPAGFVALPPVQPPRPGEADGTPRASAGTPPDDAPGADGMPHADDALVAQLRRGEASGKPMLAHVLPFLEGEPVTEQAMAARLLHALNAARVGDGDLLPTYDELGQQAGVRPHWIHRGMAHLEAHGLIDTDNRRGGQVLVGTPAPSARLPLSQAVFERQLAALGSPLYQPAHRNTLAWLGYLRQTGVNPAASSDARLSEALLAGAGDAPAARRQLDGLWLDLGQTLQALEPHAAALQARGLSQPAAWERAQVDALRQWQRHVVALRDALAPPPEPAAPAAPEVDAASEAMRAWLAGSGLDARSADRLARGGDPRVTGSPLASPLLRPELRGTQAVIGFLRTLGVDPADPLTLPGRVREVLLPAGDGAWRRAEIDRLQAEIARALPALQVHAQALADAGLPLAAAQAQRDVQSLAGLSHKLAWLRDAGAP